MKIARKVLVLGLAIAAVVTGVLLVATQYGFVAEYGGGGGVTILAFAVVPIGLALVAAKAAGWQRVPQLSLLTFTIVLALALVAAFPMGNRAHDRRIAAEDRNFSCNGPNAEIRVDARVDDAFRELPHAAPLYGPIEGSRYGCTAGISGAAAETFGAWRSVLLESGWTVADDADQVRVTRDDLVAVLSRDGGTATLRITADEPADCADARASAEEGEVSAC